MGNDCRSPAAATPPDADGGWPADALMEVETPAYVFDEAAILRDVALTRAAIEGTGATLLFAMKACFGIEALKILSGPLDGFHASSLFEARLARDLLGPAKHVHVTTPGLVGAEVEEIALTADHLSFNSLSQWERHGAIARGKVGCGLRINPRRSLVRDERYDPCRRHSKLGAPIDEVLAVLATEPQRLEGISGLLLHTNCEENDTAELYKLVAFLDEEAAPLLTRIQWINLGGGYLFFEPERCEPLRAAIALLRSKYALDVYLEPGASLIRRGGSLVASVVDQFDSEGANVAVLDASVNHLAEVFEYQFEADVDGDDPRARHCHKLAGSTCLAGDVFGDYCFAAPLSVGSRIVFRNIGAYSLVKATMFNGVNMPAIYVRTAEGRFQQKRQFTYGDFLTRCGGPSHEGL